ncbi:uncharacterized protein [Medicago truncatula]|uniref:uncharacterized protein isoform X2 n=1 Tax=Medicago truncatula TaxID=3880 RepID=UPI000D2F1D03|nr:uncharacterized protein LOC11430927 isoform X2 [Medicago truncatula]
MENGISVSVEYGLYEMMSWRAIRLEVAPKNENWGFNISEREAMLSAGTVDKNVERVYKEEKKRMDVNCLQNHSIQSAYHVAQRLLCLKYSNQVGNTIRPALMNLKECCCLKFISLKFIVVVFERTDTKDESMYQSLLNLSLIETITLPFILISRAFCWETLKLMLKIS